MVYKYFKFKVVLNLPNAASFNTVLQVVEIPAIRLFLLLLHNFFATVKNCKYLICNPDEKTIHPPEGSQPQVEKQF